ncbi:MAG: S1 RNA-binding domain-containing protein, partial [Pseudomonadota bacterium]
ITDLSPGMALEGVVTNVTNFGAFVDIGVHQDGLVHISHLADRFVKHPRDVVKTGDMVNVKVLEVDVPRRRISLTMKSDGKSTPEQMRQGHNGKSPGKDNRREHPPRSAMADALAKALKK